ncbi:MAG: FixH family protein [Bacteroidia bacterium]
MKLNWGHGIAIFVLIFIVFILNLVYKCTKENVDLVRADYYDKEIHFQDQINSTNNTKALATPLNVLSQNNEIRIDFPQSLKDSGVEGTITLMKPDNAKFDFNVPVRCDGNLTQAIPSEKMQKGLWNIIINFKSGSTPYYFEQKLMVN